MASEANTSVVTPSPAANEPQGTDVAIEDLPDEHFAPAGGEELADAGASEGAAVDDTHDQEVADLESFFAEEDKSDNDDDDADEDAADDGGQLGGRAQRRIRKLSSDLKSATAQTQALEQKLQQQYQWSQQAYQAYQRQQQMLQQHQIEMAKLQTLVENQHGQRGEPEDDVAKFRRQIKEELLSEATESVSPQLKAALDKANNLEKQWRQAQAHQQREMRRQQYNQQVDTALEQVIKPLVDADTYESNRSLLGGLVISLAYGQGGDMETAANTLRSVINRMALGVIRHRRSTQGAKVEATQQVPEKVRGKPAATGDAMPAIDLLRKNGYRDYLKWQLAGSPPLS